MKRAQEQDFSEFVVAHRVQLRRIAYALCGDWDRADDLVQVALIKLYRAWPRVCRDGRELGYVRTILVRSNIDESRAPWRREESHPDDSWFFHEASLPAAEPEEWSDLFAAVQGLAPMQRRTVLLRHWLGLSVAETADALRISEGTVKSHTSRALATLHDVLERDDGSSVPGGHLARGRCP